MRRNCKWPGCTGVVGADGLCDKEWHDQSRAPGGEPRPDDSVDTSPPAPPATGPAPDIAVESPPAPTAGRSQVGAGVVYVPPAPPVDPTEVVQTDPTIPPRVICNDCSRTVLPGDGAAGDAEWGQCACGARYDFTPKLRPGELVDHYEIVGVLDRGGQGWIHLAEDLNLNHMPCVLKARRHTEDPDAIDAEKAELDALAELSHPGVVKVLNCVEHPDRSGRDHRYLVMEYVAGHSLEHRRRLNGSGTVEATEALAFMHAVMPALGHLHEHGFVYCDLKPENVMHADDAMILVDLGAARRMEAEPGINFATRGYRAPELSQTGPSVASDIYSAGRTLAVLICGSWKRWWEREDEYKLPPRDHPNLRDHDCLWRLLCRACAAKPGDRFVDTDEMAEALHGVMHQVTAQITRTPRPYASQRWEAPRAQLGRIDWRSLPVPMLPEQPSRPSTFSAVGGADPEATIRVATKADLSWADRAVLVRAHCEVDDLDAAAQAATQLDPTAEHRDGHPSQATSRVEAARQYLIGVVAMAQGIAAEAVDRLERAYNIAPGEPACAFALAAALEAGGNDDWLAQAERLYEQAAATDPSWVAATAGRARALQALGHSEAGARVLTTVPELHPFRYEALTKACRAVTPGEYYAEVAKAAWELLPSREHDSWSAREAELAAAFYTMSWAALKKGLEIEVDGGAASADDLAVLAARALHRQAVFAMTEAERHRLLDKAARVRPWSWW